MNKIFLLMITLVTITLSLEAGDVNSQKKESLKEKHIKEQMEREKKFAKEQKFYQSDEYDFSEQGVDPKDLETIEVIKPENDFDITDVYRDDI